MPNVNVNGTNLHYAEAGRGLPVVLVHGFPLDHRIWHEQVRELSSICRVITPDLRGFGQSKSDSAFTIASLAEDLYVMLAQIRALPCVLGGLSMGGYVALAYQRSYPSTLRGLMLIDTRAEADSPEGRQGRDTMIQLARTEGSNAIAEKMLAKMMVRSGETHPSTAAEVRTIMEQCPALTIEHALAAMRDRADYSAGLSSIVAPTLIIVGDSDAITPPASAEAMHKAIAGSTLATIPNAGHLACAEEPLHVNRAIKQFLRTLAS